MIFINKKMRLSEARLKQIINESVEKVLNESFKSNSLRSWFKQHGGVNKQYSTDGLGDVTDDQIAYTQEYQNWREAYNFVWNGRKSPNYMRYFIKMYVANDGAALVVFYDRNKVETGSNWGGENFKKLSKRKWRDDQDPNAKNQKNDVYYYGGQPHRMYGNVPANDFGLWTDANYKGSIEDLKRAKQRYIDYYTPETKPDNRGLFKRLFNIDNPHNPTQKEIEAGRQKGEEEYRKWRENQAKHMKDYLNNNWKWHRRGIKDGPRQW